MGATEARLCHYYLKLNVLVPKGAGISELEIAAKRIAQQYGRGKKEEERQEKQSR
jgi:hypothetical protein